jgi:hypothetical protein
MVRAASIRRSTAPPADGTARACLEALRASLRAVLLNADVLAGTTDGVPRSCVDALVRHARAAGEATDRLEGLVGPAEPRRGPDRRARVARTAVNPRL